mmetsp:Transcript_1354/g.1815  ORF Transcript_1354/g.1815 Transcript_1354/m.1815 type:complete len:848 (-) Transcript_1354:301-2844(-)
MATVYPRRSYRELDKILNYDECIRDLDELLVCDAMDEFEEDRRLEMMRDAAITRSASNENMKKDDESVSKRLTLERSMQTLEKDVEYLTHVCNVSKSRRRKTKDDDGIDRNSSVDKKQIWTPFMSRVVRMASKRKQKVIHLRSRRFTRRIERLSILIQKKRRIKELQLSSPRFTRRIERLSKLIQNERRRQKLLFHSRRFARRTKRLSKLVQYKRRRNELEVNHRQFARWTDRLSRHIQNLRKKKQLRKCKEKEDDVGVSRKSLSSQQSNDSSTVNVHCTTQAGKDCRLDSYSTDNGYTTSFDPTSRSFVIGDKGVRSNLNYIQSFFIKKYQVEGNSHLLRRKRIQEELNCILRSRSSQKIPRTSNILALLPEHNKVASFPVDDSALLDMIIDLEPTDFMKRVSRTVSKFREGRKVRFLKHTHKKFISRIAHVGCVVKEMRKERKMKYKEEMLTLKRVNVEKSYPNFIREFYDNSNDRLCKRRELDMLKKRETIALMFKSCETSNCVRMLNVLKVITMKNKSLVKQDRESGQSGANRANQSILSTAFISRVIKTVSKTKERRRHRLMNHSHSKFLSKIKHLSCHVKRMRAEKQRRLSNNTSMKFEDSNCLNFIEMFYQSTANGDIGKLKRRESVVTIFNLKSRTSKRNTNIISLVYEAFPPWSTLYCAPKQPNIDMSIQSAFISRVERITSEVRRRRKRRFMKRSHKIFMSMMDRVILQVKKSRRRKTKLESNCLRLNERKRKVSSGQDDIRPAPFDRRKRQKREEKFVISKDCHLDEIATSESLILESFELCSSKKIDRHDLSASRVSYTTDIAQNNSEPRSVSACNSSDDGQDSISSVNECVAWT